MYSDHRILEALSRNPKGDPTLAHQLVQLEDQTDKNIGLMADVMISEAKLRDLKIRLIGIAIDLGCLGRS